MRTLLFVLLISLIGLAQKGSAQFHAPAKEQFDKLGHKVLYNGVHAGIVNYMLNTNPWSGYQFGEQVGPTLEAYLRLYESSNDKAYLVKFVNLALLAIAWRREDYRFNDLLYMDGQLLWPIAHFIHLVLIDEPELGSFELVNHANVIDVPSSTISINQMSEQPGYTLNEIATWMLARSVESLDAIMADEWDQDIGFKGAAAVNMQGAFAGALLHLGHMSSANSSYSGLYSYLDKGARIAALFRSNVHIEDDCSCASYSQPALRTADHNSYWWFHAGWYFRRESSCVSHCTPFFHFNQADLLTFQEFTEDISHAIPALIIPLTSHRYSLYTDGSYPFTNSELVRFRNTFTRHIWDAQEGGFHSAVNGQDSPISPSSNDDQFDLLKYSSLAWMPLHRFDATFGAASGGLVYNIIMDFYENEVYDSPTDLTGGFHYYGLAEVVAAQWEHECFSLDLYNRELVYDQDFAAKNVLRVFPAGEAGASFADPVIYEPRFTVNENIRSEFRAGSAVLFEPGFEAVRGSVVEAVIDPLGCDLAYKANLPIEYPRTEVRAPEAREHTMMEQDAPVAVEQTTERQMMDAFRLVPNPTSGETYAELHLSDQRNASLNIHDALGRQVWSGQFGTLVAGEHRHPVGIRLPAGVYHCTLSLDGVQHTQRLVVE
jgi:hypothetical protein